MIYRHYKFGFITTSNVELFDLLKAWVAISIAFGIAMGGVTIKFFESFLIAAIAVGAGFFFHELSHKVVAQRYGHFAEFRSFDLMLLLAIAMSFLGFVFVAPGAVMIEARGYYNRKQNGLISIAGPAMNILLAIIFLVMRFFVGSGIVEVIADYGFMINSWLALFNMIPFWMFDGKKVFDWNKIVWVLFTVICIIFVFVLGKVVL